MLKFKFKSEEGAREAKAYIQETAEMLDYMTLSEVISNYGMPIESAYPSENAANVGWRWSDLKGQNIMVRKVRKTWYLYLCAPTLNVNDISKPQDDYIPEESVSDETPKNKMEYEYQSLEHNPNGTPGNVFTRILFGKEEVPIDEILGALSKLTSMHNNRRKCMVWRKSKKKNVIAEEFPCWCHGWMPNRVMKDNGDSIDQTLFICEFQDGHVERIDHSHIRFVEEWT